MSGWSIHDGQAVALPRESIDTDQLIPARFMSAPRSEGYGSFLLHDMRQDGSGEQIADFPLNRHPRASVLVARRNFGSGSSREAAVYALVDFGIRVVIAPSFGDIFCGNAINNQLLPLVLPEETVEAILSGLGPGVAPTHIDLHSGTATIGDRTYSFDLPEIWREKLINGWDDIDLTASRAEAIMSYRDSRKAAAPWVWPPQ
ncbi:3-isopropylmalate dehydratase small subunit [Hoeflea sp.]|uniref:3-isopropylmalate dehydratase small subunit n=1 Tax=Hoeflea sp. TaxID=1940281 RepID=UPI0037488C94